MQERMSPTCDVVVLLSGTGSNLQALIDSVHTGDSPVRIAAVISNRADAYGLQRAKDCLLYTSPSPRDRQKSRMPSSA